MSLITWTVEELSSRHTSKSGEAWRLTESQSVNSTLKLVDNLDEQSILEEEIDLSKPPYFSGTESLDFLLKTPFRYSPTHDNASRFRQKGQKEGAFYASTKVETAVAEVAFHALRFYLDSPDTPFPEVSIPKTAFSIGYKTRKALDLRGKDFDCIRNQLEHLTDYNDCQTIANKARECETEVLLSNSVRCSNNGENVTLLSANAFDGVNPRRLQSWDFVFKEDVIIARSKFPRSSLEFWYKDWADDKRVEDFIK